MVRPQPAVPSKKGVTGAIVAVTFRKDQVDGVGKKLIRPSAGDFADATSVFLKPEWDATRGGNFDPHPVSYTKALSVEVDVEIVFTLNPSGGTALLTGIHGVSTGHDFLSFDQTMSRPIKTGRTPIPGLTSKGKLPNFVSFEDHGITWTAVVNGKPVDLGSTLHRVYVTFAEPIGKMESTVPNRFTETGKVQDVTEERLEYSVKAAQGKGVNDERECVDAIFLKLMALNVNYVLFSRWEPDPLNNTHIVPKPPLHQYLWRCNAATAQGECHNIAAAFQLACRILGVTGTFEIGFMYPRPSRLENHPVYARDPNATLGAYSSGDAAYSRQHAGLSHGWEKLLFLDGSGHANNFEGVARYKNGLYAIGDAIFDQDASDPQKNAAVYYAVRNIPCQADGRSNGIDMRHGLFDLVFIRTQDGGCRLPYTGMTHVEFFTQPLGNVLEVVRFKWHN
jgi:hypothetical protein